MASTHLSTASLLLARSHYSRCLRVGLAKLLLCALLVLTGCSTAPSKQNSPSLALAHLPADARSDGGAENIDQQLALAARNLYWNSHGDVKFINQDFCSIEVSAHRGDLRHTENSLAAIRLALASGADTVEIDIQRLRDGIWVLHHDSYTGRATSFSSGKRYKVESLDAEQWSQLLMRDPASGELLNMRPPTLYEAVKLVAQLATPTQRLNIEFKSDTNVAELQKIDWFLRQQLGDNRYYYSSANIELLEKIRGINPVVYLGLIQYPHQRSITEVKNTLKKAAGTDALYQRYQAQLDTWSDVAIRYKSRGQRNWMGASDLAELKRRIGARAGLHLDIRHLQESPRVLSRAQTQGVDIQTYSINSPSFHVEGLQQLAKQHRLPHAAIVDVSAYHLCSRLYGGVSSQPTYQAQTPAGKVIQVLPLDADFSRLDEQSFYLEHQSYIALSGRVKALPTRAEKSSPAPRLLTPEFTAPVDERLDLDTGSAIRIRLDADE